MDAAASQDVLQIKRYPNRRYYDAGRSRHVTLQEVYDSIVAGSNVCIIDSRTGEDLTNLILIQMVLERDQAKLDLFPPSLLHMLIRSDRQVVRASLQRHLRPLVDTAGASQKQLDPGLRQARHENAPLHSQVKALSFDTREGGWPLP